MVGRQFGLWQKRMAPQTSRASGVAGWLCFSAFGRLPSFQAMTVGAICGRVIDRSRMWRWRCVTGAANKFQRGKHFVGMALGASQFRMFAGQTYRMIEGVFRPGGFGGMAAAARRRDAVWTDVAGLAIFRAANLGFLVTLLTTGPWHDTPQPRFLMLGDDSAMATRASKGCVTVGI